MNMNIQHNKFVKLPNQIQDGLKSRGINAKRVATMFNEHKDEVKKIFAKPKLNQIFEEKRNVYFSDASQKVKLDIYEADPRFKFIYEHGDFRQCEYSDNVVINRQMSNNMGRDIVTEYNNGNSSLTQSIPRFGNRIIPCPLLLNNNGILKTLYTSHPCDMENLISGGRPFDDPINISDEGLVNFVEKIDRNSPVEMQAFKIQYGKVMYFNDNKNEVFDKPIELAEIAFNKITNDTIDEKIILDIGNAGDRIEVKKQGDVFNIDYYDEDNKLSMQGEFEVLRDEMDNPLKEDNDGKILSSNDNNYNNPENKLCFNMKLSTYYKDAEIKSFDFKRFIDTENKKHRHNMSFLLYDKKGNKVFNNELFLPKYSKNWLKRRMCKIKYNTYKTDLKAINADLTNRKLDPKDIQL